MRRPTLLQISFGISILCHLALFGLYEIYRVELKNVTAQTENNSENPIVLTVVTAPAEPAAPSPIPQSVPPPKPPAPKPISTPIVFQPPQPKPPEPKIAISMPPVPMVPSKPAPPAAPAIDISDTSEKIEAPAPPAISTQPDYLKNPAPVYPAAARRRHEEGLVILTVNVSTEGHAARVSVKKSSGFKLLDDAAVATVQNWEFQPAQLGPVSLESDVEVPIRFELTQP